jgi:hypothetical protein
MAKTSPSSNRRDASGTLRERIIDVLTKIQGVVVGVDGERVMFHCREFGRVWRERELVVKISR